MPSFSSSTLPETDMSPLVSTHVSTCIGCGCDDLHACYDEPRDAACFWERVDRHAGHGVCSACPEYIDAWDAGDRAFRVPVDDHTASMEPNHDE